MATSLFQCEQNGRCANNIIPSRTNLLKRGINLDATFPVWKQTLYNSSIKSDFNNSLIDEWFHLSVQTYQLSLELISIHYLLVAMACRNNIVHGQTIPNPTPNNLWIQNHNFEIKNSFPCNHFF